MTDTIVNVEAPANTWVDIYADAAVIAAGISVGDAIKVQVANGGLVRLVVKGSKPTSADGFNTLTPSNDLLTNATGASGAWVYSPSIDSEIAVSISYMAFEPYKASDFPDGAFAGTRALTTQSYTEANSKNGTEHEGSTLLSAVAGGASNDTMFVTGALTVSLKGRVIGYTGDGVTARIFTGATYTGGTSVPYENASDINPVTGLSQIIVGATVTDDGTLAFAPDHLIGNTSNQGKGSTGAVIGREKLLKANTIYLFRLTSLDSAAQDITSLLTWYEGDLDFPLP